MKKHSQKNIKGALGKTLKASLPVFALMGAGVGSCRSSFSSGRFFQRKPVVFVATDAPEPSLHMNLADTKEPVYQQENSQAEGNVSESKKSDAKHSINKVFNAFSSRNVAKKKSAQSNIKVNEIESASAKTLAFLSDNGWLSQGETKQAELSGNMVHGSKVFAQTLGFTTMSYSAACPANPTYNTFSYMSNISANNINCILTNGFGVNQTAANHADCQALFDTCNSAGDNSDGNLTASATVTEPVGLDTTADTAGEAVNVFDFTLTDGGGGDGNAMTVSQIVVNVGGTSTDAERAAVTWRLNGPDASNVTGVYNAGANTITFSGLSISIADGASETYTVNAYYNNNTAIVEDRTFTLSVDGGTDVTVGGSGTQMGMTSAVTNGAGGTWDVLATALAFTTQPAGSVSGAALSTQPVVTARDAFGNTDVDFSETIILTEASAGTLSGGSIGAAFGVATFTAVNYTATADQQSFTLTASVQDGGGSGIASVNANAVTSDVVATQLVYTTQPAPLNIVSGLATSFTTVPVVAARDAAGVTDTGYSTDVTVSEINGAGSAIISSTGDTDGNAADASTTVTPSSGVATFTGMQITYVNGGGSSENFNLRASSGGLIVADSSQLTSLSLDSDGNLTAAAGVTEPVNLGTTVDTIGEAIDVFDFTLSDGGTADGMPMAVSQVVVDVGGSSTDAERAAVTWRLNGPDASNVTGTYNAGSDTLTFSGLSISIADGTSETYTINAYYNNNTAIVEDRTFTLSVDGGTDVTVGGSGTQMGMTSAVTNGAGGTWDVLATALAFTTQPAGSVSGAALSTQPVVTARDAFGNTDVDFSETIILTEASAGTLSGGSIGAAFGVATFTAVNYTATADQQSFTLTASVQDGGGSGIASVNANAVTSDVVATQLVFDTQPAGLSVYSGQAYSLTTVPVVSAKDGNNIVDTGYSTGITLSEINGAGSAIVSSTGDTDGSAATTTITPSSGVSTFTGMQLTYTNSGVTSETFNLQATAAGLTSATSSQFSSAVSDTDGSLTAAAGVTEPVGIVYSADTAIEAVDVFDFTLSDAAGGDGLAFGVSEVRVAVTGTTNDAERAKITWRLNGPDAVNALGTYNAGTDTLTFTGLSISVADGASEIYTINSYFNDNTGLTHGNTVVLSVDGDTDLTVAGAGTQMGPTTAVTNGTGTVITDDLGPQVVSVSVPANSTYTAAGNLDFTVNYNENVTVNTGSGTPRLTLTVGSTTRYASYVSGSGTSALVFRYTVQAGEEDDNGVSLASTVDPNLGTLQDAQGNTASNTLNSVGSLASVLVDSIAPVLAETTPVTSLGNDSTPNVSFSSDEAGTLSVGGSCGSASEGAISSGTQAIALTQPDNSTALAGGSYSDCTLTVTDAAGNASDALSLTAFTIDIAPPSVSVNTGQSFDEGGTGVIANTSLSSADNTSAAAAVTYTLVAAPANGTLRRSGSALANGATFTQADIDSTLISYLHDGGETTSDAFTFTLTDGLGNVNNNTGSNFAYSITINSVNDAPSAVNDVEVTNEDEAVMVDVLANDSDPDNGINAASVTVVSAPSNGSTSVNTGTGVITYTPSNNYEGNDSFTYTVEDVSGQVSNTATVAISILAQNDVPVAVADMTNTNINTPVTIDVAANDTDIDSGDAPDSGTIAIVSTPSNGAAVINAGQIDYTPASDFTGTDSFTYTINDSNGAPSNVATVTVNVIDPNILPVATDDSASTDEDTAVNVTVLSNDSDADGSIVVTTVAVLAAPANGGTSVNAATGVITYTPNANFNGTDTFTYTVQDDVGGTSNAATVTVTVISVNDAPVLSDDVVVLQEDNSLNINVLGNDSDVDGTINPATVAIVTQPAQGSVVVNAATGVVTYTPAAEYSGNDSFTYRAADNLDAVSNIATVTLTVNAVNDAPLANDDSAEVLTEQDVVIDLFTNDIDVDGTLEASSIVFVTSPTLGSVVNNNDGTVTYTPTTTESGNDVFTYTVEDNNGSVSNTATVDITITKPTAIAITGTPVTSIEEGQTYSFTPSVDVFAGLTPTYSIENAPAWASFNTETGVLTGMVLASDIGTYEGVVITVADGYSSASLPAFSIVVASGVDTDGDTISDYQEGVDGTDPFDATDYLDLTSPEVTPPDDIILDATGLFTPVSLTKLLGLSADATDEQIQSRLDLIVVDNVDGVGCCEPEVTDMEDGVILLAPGLHQVEWQATDFMGNQGFASQAVHVRPLVSFSKDKTTVEGSSVTVRVLLNGLSPTYPFTVPYVVDTVTSTTDNTIVGEVVTSSDHNLSDGTVVFNEGETEAVIQVLVTADAVSEPDEVLVLALDDATSNEQDLTDGFDADIYDINSGVKNTYRLTIVERNIAPEASLQAEQGGMSTIQITAGGGNVVITASVFDENTSDTHTLDWSATDNRLSDLDSTETSFTFDPASLNEGRYRISLLVTDSEGATDRVVLHLVLVDELPILDSETDSDGDGIDDETEGTSDDDDDGIANYLDNIQLPNVIPEAVRQTNAFLIECEPGVRCRLGEFALVSRSGGARLDDDDIALQTDIVDDENFIPTGGIFDFEIHDLPTLGQTVQIVIPQIAAIPSNAIYRKFQNGAWVDFVENDSNQIHSTAGNLGFCPPPGDSSWQAGLVAGHYCVQLTIEDGGPNDTDGEVNASVVDPGAVSQRRTSTTNVTTSGGGGAVSIPLFSILFSLMLLGLCSRKAKPAKASVGMLCVVIACTLGSAPVEAETSGLKNILAKSAIEIAGYQLKGSQSEADFTRELNASGFNITTNAYDTSTTAYSVTYSYEIHSGGAVIMAYTDLGDVDTDFTVTLVDGVDDEAILRDALEESHPLTGSGITLGYRYDHRFMEKLTAFAEGGVFIWDADIDTNIAGIKPEHDGGTDLTFGFGAGYSVSKNIEVQLSYLYHKLDDQNTCGLGLGVKYRFQ